MHSHKLLAVVCCALVLAFTVAACGSDEASSNSSGSATEMGDVSGASASDPEDAADDSGGEAGAPPVVAGAPGRTNLGNIEVPNSAAGWTQVPAETLRAIESDDTFRCGMIAPEQIVENSPLFDTAFGPHWANGTNYVKDVAGFNSWLGGPCEAAPDYTILRVTELDRPRAAFENYGSAYTQGSVSCTDSAWCYQLDGNQLWSLLYIGETDDPAEIATLLQAISGRS